MSVRIYSFPTSHFIGKIFFFFGHLMSKGRILLTDLQLLKLGVSCA